MENKPAVALMGVLQPNGHIMSETTAHANVLVKTLQAIRAIPEDEREENNRLDKLLDEAEIDPLAEYAPPQVCLEIVTNGEKSIIGTLGNFSVAKGKAKVGKTFATTLLAAAAASSDPIQGKIKGSLPVNKSQVLYFDTEQGRCEATDTARRIIKLAGTPTNFKTYSLRKYKPSERLELIERKLYNTLNLGFVVIDGIRDLVTSINDEAEACMINSKLLKWTEELEIHILCIIHENKGNEDLRGHIGTELQNKAETIIQVLKDKTDKSAIVVQAERCRRKEFEPFAFEIDPSGMPQIIENWMFSGSSEPSKRGVKPKEILPEKHLEILQDAFNDTPLLLYKDLVEQIKYAHDKQGHDIGDNKAKEYITWCKNEGYIDLIKPEDSRYNHYQLKQSV